MHKFFNSKIVCMFEFLDQERRLTAEVPPMALQPIFLSTSFSMILIQAITCRGR